MIHDAAVSLATRNRRVSRFSVSDVSVSQVYHGLTVWNASRKRKCQASMVGLPQRQRSLIIERHIFWIQIVNHFSPPYVRGEKTIHTTVGLMSSKSANGSSLSHLVYTIYLLLLFKCVVSYQLSMYDKSPMFAASR